MSDVIFRGDAPAVAQVDTAEVVDTWATSDTIEVAIGDRSLTLTVGSVTTTTGIAAALKAMLAGDALVGDETRTGTGGDYPEFDELTFTVNGSTVTITGPTLDPTGNGRTSGKEFVISFTATTAGDGDVTHTAAATAGDGPHWWSAANFEGGAVPGAADDAWIFDWDDDILYGLDQSGAGTLASLHLMASFTGNVGLPKNNEDNDIAYYEYRQRSLKINATLVHVGEGLGQGSGRVQLDMATADFTATIHLTGSRTDQELESVKIKGGGTSSEVHVMATSGGGGVGIATDSGETCPLNKLKVLGGVVRAGDEVGGAGVDVDVSGGQVEIGISSGDTLGTYKQTGGNVIVKGAGTLAAPTVEGGTLDVRCGGGISSTPTIDGDDAVMTFDNDLVPKTVAGVVTLTRGQILDSHGIVTWTSGIKGFVNLTAAV